MSKLGMGCVLAAVASLASAASTVTAGERDNWLPFVVPDLASESTENSPVDLSFLNPEPAGANGVLRADGEQIVDAKGNVIRLFGSNMTDFHAMPPKEVSPKIARRLRQLGINFIRLHYYDWGQAPEGMMNPDMQTLHPEKLDQMDYLIAQLKENGVYVDLNTHVARGYPGMPEGWDRMGKGLDLVHRPFIDSQKQFARDLLTHTNPYTKTRYVDEPAIAMIELNNENTTLSSSMMSKIADLPRAFRGPIQQRWNAFLKTRYGTQDALEKAWTASPIHGPSLLRNGDFAASLEGWRVENAGGAESTTQVIIEGNDRYLRWTTTKPGQDSWNLQIHQTSVPIQHGTTYTLSFRGRSKTSSPMEARFMLQQAPWSNVSDGTVVKLTPEWKQYEVAFTAANPTNAATRLNLSAENKAGDFELANMKLQEGEPSALAKDESIETQTVTLSLGNNRRNADLLRFYYEQEKAYYTEMKSFVQKELGAKQMVFLTQLNYGALAGLAREAEVGDLSDVHCYPAHPSGGGNGWSWAVRQVSLCQDEFGSAPFSDTAFRPAGKPLLCTEFDLNPPNDHAGESFLYMAAIGAYQGYAGLADYAWYNFQRTYGHSRMSSNFATTGHAGQMALVPASALLFRQALIAPAKSRLTLVIPRESATSSMNATGWGALSNLLAKGNVPKTALWQRSLATRFDDAARSARIEGVLPQTGPDAGNQITSDTGELQVSRPAKGQEYLSLNAPAVRAVFGFIGGTDLKLGDVQFTVAPGTYQNYANVSLVALDGQAIAQSHKLLLTTLARVENRDAVWNAERSAVQWGKGPTVAEPVALKLALPAGSWKVQALDGNGQPTGAIPVQGHVLNTGAKAVWYLIEQ